MFNRDAQRSVTTGGRQCDGVAVIRTNCSKRFERRRGGWMCSARRWLQCQHEQRDFLPVACNVRIPCEGNNVSIVSRRSLYQMLAKIQVSEMATLILASHCWTSQQRHQAQHTTRPRQPNNRLLSLRDTDDFPKTSKPVVTSSPENRRCHPATMHADVHGERSSSLLVAGLQ